MTNEELTKTVMELEAKVSGQYEQIRTIFENIKDLKQLSESVYNLASTVKIMGEEIQRNSTSVQKLTKDIDTLKEKPARNWDTVIKVAITAIITGTITYILAQIGLN